MKEQNKETSFLYTLYQKFVKKQEGAGEGHPSAAQVIAETLEEIHAPALPPEKQYLQALYDLYLHYLKLGSLQGVALDPFAFEAWTLAQLKARPDYEQRSAEILDFQQKLSMQATLILRELTTPMTQEAQPSIEEDPARSPDWQGEEAPAPASALAPDGEALPLLADEAEPEGKNLPEAEAVLEGEAVPEPEGEAASEEEEASALLPVAFLPRDASCQIYLTKDKMCAYFFVFPAANGGRALDREDVVSTLEQGGILHGLDMGCIKRLFAGEDCFQLLQIAEGTLPTHGKDGEIVPQVECSTGIEILQNEQGIADFKNINSVHTLSKDQVICAILPPTEGVPGKTVKGESVPARNGKAAADPTGKNTKLTEDKSRLTALLDGQVTHKGGRFNVEPVLLVEGNVDYGVGNINFNGDVVIKGDVCNGFTVKAQGSVTVQGMVESADIIAGGDVLIAKGMNGNFSGTIDAKGEVKTSFLENCTVYSEGSLYASSIVSSKIFCGDTVYVLSKHGAIIGGSVTALHAVEAKVIGSQSRRETDIILGEVPRLSEKRAEAEAELQGVVDLLEKMEKNISFLEQRKDTLGPEKQDILQQLTLQRRLYSARREELEAFFEELSNAKRDFSGCRVTCGQLYPPTKVSIGTDYHIFRENASKCMIYRGVEGITLGTN